MDDEQDRTHNLDVINVSDYGSPHIGLNINKISLAGGQVTCSDDYRQRSACTVQPIIRAGERGTYVTN